MKKKNKTVNDTVAVEVITKPSINAPASLDEGTICQSKRFETEQCENTEQLEETAKTELPESDEEDDEFFDMLSEVPLDGSEEETAAASEMDALNLVMDSIRKAEGSVPAYDDTDTFASDGAGDLKEIPALDDELPDYEDNTVITYPGQHRPKRYSGYGTYKKELYKIPNHRREDYAYYTADNALITVDPDLDEEVTPELIATMHRERDNEVARNNRVTKWIPPQQKKALKAEYEKKKKKQPNCYDEMQKELRAMYTFAHYDAWVDQNGNSLLDHLPGLSTSYRESPENIAIEKIHDEELHKVLGSAIEKLDERTQKVLTLRFVYGMTHEGAGKVVGLSESGVRRIEGDALRKLRFPNRLISASDSKRNF